MTIIGYAYVVADLIHEGHMLHLTNCRALCDKLVVGVLTDEATMEKKAKPIVDFKERLRMVAALKCVDAAVPQLTYSPEPNVVAMRPDIMFESTSHQWTAIQAMKKVVDSYGGRTIVMPYYPEQSSTELKKKIKKEYDEGKRMIKGPTHQADIL
jgi:glycerol-3-phosphate cytidylyltransferase